MTCGNILVILGKPNTSLKAPYLDFDSLNQLRCNIINDLTQLNKILDSNDKESLKKYSNIVSWLSCELSDLCKLDEKVSTIDSKSI